MMLLASTFQEVVSSFKRGHSRSKKSEKEVIIKTFLTYLRTIFVEVIRAHPRWKIANTSKWLRKIIVLCWKNIQNFSHEIRKIVLILNIPWSFLTYPGAHWHPLTHDLDVLVVKWYWFKFILELSRLIWPDRPIGHPFVNISSIIASISSVLLKDNLFYIFMLIYIRCTSSWIMCQSGDVPVWGFLI